VGEERFCRGLVADDARQTTAGGFGRRSEIVGAQVVPVPLP
jgi:hypothetical protein